MNDALTVKEAEGDEDLADDEGGVLLLDRAALHLRARGRVQVQLQGRRQVAGEGGAGRTRVRMLPPLAKSMAIQSSWPWRYEPW